MDKTVLLIMICAAATYATRIGGHLILSRFDSVNHRLEAALEVVPIAVLTALVAPSIVTHGPVESLSIFIGAIVAFRYSLMTSVACGLMALVIMRSFLV